jgi:hypothetical protein
MGENAQDKEKILECFEAAEDNLVKKQMGKTALCVFLK